VFKKVVRAYVLEAGGLQSLLGLNSKVSMLFGSQVKNPQSSVKSQQYLANVPPLLLAFV
jgi:hypothetical protein